LLRIDGYQKGGLPGRAPNKPEADNRPGAPSIPRKKWT